MEIQREKVLFSPVGQMVRGAHIGTPTNIPLLLLPVSQPAYLLASLKLLVIKSLGLSGISDKTRLIGRCDGDAGSGKVTENVNML